MKRLLLLPVLILSLLFLTSGALWACQCYGTDDPPTEYEQVDAVFSGLVIQILPTSWDSMFEYVVAVYGYWKGTITPFMSVYTGIGDGDCGTPFDLYGEYLFYTTDISWPCCEGVTSDCYRRTNYLSNAGEDLEFLGPPQTVPVGEMTWGAIKEFYRE